MWNSDPATIVGNLVLHAPLLFGLAGMLVMLMMGPYVLKNWTFRGGNTRLHDAIMWLMIPSLQPRWFRRLWIPIFPIAMAACLVLVMGLAAVKILLCLLWSFYDLWNDLPDKRY